MNWMIDVYPAFFKSLQEPLFSELLKGAHPSCEISDEDCSHLLNVLRGILCYNSEKRPSATKILEPYSAIGKLFQWYSTGTRYGVD